MNRAIAVGAVAVVLLSGACGSPEPIAPPSAPPTRSSTETAGPSPSIYPVPPSPGTEAPTDGPTTIPVEPNPNVERSGSTVRGKVDGQDIALDFDTVVAYPIYEPPSGEVNLTWADGAGNALTIGGRLEGGTRRTSSTLALSLALVEPEFDTFGSGDGSCRVTFVAIQPASVAGRFDCGRLTGANGATLSGASGTFEARF